MRDFPASHVWLPEGITDRQAREIRDLTKQIRDLLGCKWIRWKFNQPNHGINIRIKQLDSNGTWFGLIWAILGTQPTKYEEIFGMQWGYRTEDNSTKTWKTYIYIYIILIRPWVKTYGAIFGWMNIHLPSILMFTRVPWFWPMAICWYVDMLIWRSAKNLLNFWIPLGSSHKKSTTVTCGFFWNQMIG